MRVEMVLGFPNRYAVGMSNLGFQTVYGLFNQTEGARCERTFLWESGGSGTLESGRSLRRFPLLAFSVPFELDYLNLLEILNRADVPLLASQRGRRDPIVVVGGPCAFLNPEPLAPFVDMFIIGEAEGVIPRLMEVVKTAASRDEILEASRQIPGVYLPQLYQVSYLPDGRIGSVSSPSGAPRRIERQWTAHLDAVATFSPIISPLSHFKEMCLIEVQRGCAYSCRFCAMGLIYHPFRQRTLSSLQPQIEAAQKRGARIGLVGSAVADLPDLLDLCRFIAPGNDVLGLSSLRADKVTAELVDRLAELGIRTVTIAPEVGTERMRRVIDKTVSREDVLRTASLAAAAGIRRVKLYFIIGLPGEKEEDLLAILDLVQDVGQGSGLRSISVSVSSFVPKAATPLQWAAMETESILRHKMEILAQGLRRLKGVTFSGESPRSSLWQGLLSMGDRRVGRVLWHHLAERLTWARAWRKVGVERGFFVHRERDFPEILPWDIIDHGISKEKLWTEYLRARA